MLPPLLGAMGEHFSRMHGPVFPLPWQSRGRLADRLAESAAQNASPLAVERPAWPSARPGKGGTGKADVWLAHWRAEGPHSQRPLPRRRLRRRRPLPRAERRKFWIPAEAAVQATLTPLSPPPGPIRLALLPPPRGGKWLPSAPILPFQNLLG